MYWDFKTHSDTTNRGQTFPNSAKCSLNVQKVLKLGFNKQHTKQINAF